MSRFWTAAGDDEESEGSEFTDSGGEEETQERSGYSKWGLGGRDSSDSEEEQRTVVSGKDKHFNALEQTCDSIEEALEQKDWVSVLEQFTKLMDQVGAAKKVIRENGLPAFFVSQLDRLGQHQKEAASMTKSERRAMNKQQSKALNTLKQRTAKCLKEYAREIEKFKELEAAREGEDGERDGEDGEVETIVLEPIGTAIAENTSFYDSPAREGKDKKEIAQLDELSELLARRGKRGFDKNDQIRQLIRLVKAVGTVQREIQIWFHLIAAIFDTSSIAGHMTTQLWRQAWRALSSVVGVLDGNPQLRMKPDESLPGSALAVGVGSGDSDKHVPVVGNLVVFLERLDEELMKALKLVDQRSVAYVKRMRDIRLVERLARSVYDYYLRVGDNESCARVAILRLGHIYVKNEWVNEKQYEQYKVELEEDRDRQAREAEAQAKGIVLEANKDDDDDEDEDEKEDDELEDDEEDGEDDEDDEGARKQARELKRIEEKIRRQAEKRKPKERLLVPDRRILEKQPLPYVSCKELLDTLSSFVFKHGDQRQKTHCVLFIVTHRACHDEYKEARDILLMSHLQESVHHMDMDTQILYNRATVQLGLCAFRVGLIYEAHHTLTDICSGGKIKELLAQGAPRPQDRTPEQERLDRIRQVPFHLHINLEHVECAHMISGMLLEVPNMAANANETRRKTISRPFRKLLDWFDRQHLSGPPENPRETILAAARGLQRGDWKEAREYILKLRMWKLMPNAEKIQATLMEKIKEEALRTHMLTHAGCYSSVSLADLSEYYELPKSSVHCVVSKMMINEELHAAWDQPTESIIMHDLEPSKLQTLALQYSEKVSLLVDTNERAFDGRGGQGGHQQKYYDNRQKGGPRHHKQGQRTPDARFDAVRRFQC